MKRNRMEYRILVVALMLAAAVYGLQAKAQGGIFNESIEQSVAMPGNGSFITPFATPAGSSPFKAELANPLYARPDEIGDAQKLDGLTVTGGWWVLLGLCVVYALFRGMIRRKTEVRLPDKGKL